MEIGIYEPPPRSPSPPPPPPRKYRSAIIMGAVFVGGFCMTFAVLGRHELAAMISHHATKAAVAELHPPALAPAPQTKEAANVQPPPAQPHTSAMPPSVFQ